MDNKLYLVIASWCPYCQRTLKWIDELINENEKYKDLQIEVIDEEQNPQEAAKYSYKLVPNIHLQGKKIFEGAAVKEDIIEALDKAYEAQKK